MDEKTSLVICTKAWHPAAAHKGASMTKRVSLTLSDGSAIGVVWNDNGDARKTFNAVVTKDEKPLGLIGYCSEGAYCDAIAESVDSEEIEGVLQEILAALLIKHKRPRRIPS
jgi:hypothetical protein